MPSPSPTPPDELLLRCHFVYEVWMLGRGLISAGPKADRSKLDEGEVIGGELVITGGDTPALLVPIEEPLDQLARPVEMGTEADGVLAVQLRRYVGPGALLADERSDSVGILRVHQHGAWIAGNREQHMGRSARRTDQQGARRC
jgi:hypothetical protein